MSRNVFRSVAGNVIYVQKTILGVPLRRYHKAHNFLDCSLNNEMCAALHAWHFNLAERSHNLRNSDEHLFPRDSIGSQFIFSETKVIAWIQVDLRF